MTAKLNGKKYALEEFCSQHRAKFQQLVKESQHINFQVPNEHTQIGYLIDNLENSDAALEAAIASIRQDTNGSRNDFKRAFAILLPVDPYAKNAATKRTVSFEISPLSSKNGRGKSTGVDLRWYSVEEYAKLSSDERSELRE